VKPCSSHRGFSLGGILGDELSDPVQVHAKAQQNLVADDHRGRDESPYAFAQLLHVLWVGHDITLVERHLVLSKETLCRVAIRSGGLRVDDH
jgi:hypothetical protein